MKKSLKKEKMVVKRKKVSKKIISNDNHMRLVKIPISTGGAPIAVLCEEDARRMRVRPGDRISIHHKSKKIIAVIDTAHAQKLLSCGSLGLFDEAVTLLGAKSGTKLLIKPASKPLSVYYIRKKLHGATLTKSEIQEIIRSIVNRELTDIEQTYFVCACFSQEMTDRETADLTLAMIESGKKLGLKSKIILDKHCIGGVAGNRTTPIVIAIVAAAGYIIPKTSSRSITSPAGTSDTIEVMAKVDLSLSQMKQVIKKTNACLVWGGALDLAPADDKIIKVEHAMSLDPVGQLIASILAKKKSVGSTHVLIDIPVGIGAKVHDMSRAKLLKRKFEKIGKILGMKVKVVITDGSEPIGNGIGPALEARDILWTLQNDSRGSSVLKKKSIEMASKLLELIHVKNAKTKVIEIFNSGKAYEKFLEILQAQGLKCANPTKIAVGSLKKTIFSSRKGKIIAINNHEISRIAKIAGAPFDARAGIYLHVHKKSVVKKNQPLYTIYSDSSSKIRSATSYAKINSGIKIK